MTPERASERASKIAIWPLREARSVGGLKTLCRDVFEEVRKKALVFHCSRAKRPSSLLNSSRSFFIARNTKTNIAEGQKDVLRNHENPIIVPKQPRAKESSEACSLQRRGNAFYRRLSWDISPNQGSSCSFLWKCVAFSEKLFETPLSFFVIRFNGLFFFLHWVLVYQIQSLIQLLL